MRIDEITKDEFVDVLDGSYDKKLRDAFKYGYELGYEDGGFGDERERVGQKLDQDFEEWKEHKGY